MERYDEKVGTAVHFGHLVDGRGYSQRRRKASSQSGTPASWEEWRDYRQRGGDLGSWVAKGKTEAIWEGIPAGLEYQETTTWEIINGGGRIRRSHQMVTEDGTIISVGSGNTCWDKESGTVRTLYAGYDMGKPFTGHNTLIGYDKLSGAVRWKYTETSHGKTTDYLIDVTLTSRNTGASSVRKSAGGDPWNSTLTRVNPLVALTSRFNLVGTWQRDLPDGSRHVMAYTLALDGRALFRQDRQIKPDGSVEQIAAGAMWWNAARGKVCTHFLNSYGSSFMGEMVSFTSDGDTATQVLRARGSTGAGVGVSGTVTRVLKGDTLEFHYVDVTRQDQTSPVDTSESSTTFTRVKDD